ncbi:MAG TPA: class I SAM-dependent methyltransferase [Aliidongia sp.]|nr:class I SAM-dependent methyltransferase [Aliidongia sp.]
MATDERPFDYRVVWEEKPALRAIYRSYYQEILARCRPGRTLEIGGGSGNMKNFAPAVISTDILPAPWLDAVADAQRLPFASESFDNIVMFDVLHHVERPRMFLDEAARVLRSGGRIVMIEPAITPLSGLFYRNFHPEPVDMSADPLVDGPLDPARDAFEANQAIPTLLFSRQKARLASEFATLRLVESRRLALFTYPLSGGFRSWSLLPGTFVRPLLRIEQWLEPILGWFMAFRMIVVIERRGHP